MSKKRHDAWFFFGVLDATVVRDDQLGALVAKVSRGTIYEDIRKAGNRWVGMAPSEIYGERLKRDERKTAKT